MTDQPTPLPVPVVEQYFGHERLVFDAGDGQIVKLIWVLPGVWSFAHLRAVRQTGEQPGFIPVLVADTARDGRPFLVHERVDAGGFWQWDQATRDSDDQIQVLWQAARALTEAHLRGVYHGAFYPGAVVIIDDEDVALAEVGYGMGGAPPFDLMEWVAPEFQADYGMSAAADVWSLGRMLDRVPDLPPQVRAVADQALLPEPSARPTAGEVADVIQAFYGNDFEGKYGLAFLTGTASAELGDLAVAVLEGSDEPDPNEPPPDPEPPDFPDTLAEVIEATPEASMLKELLSLATASGPVDWLSIAGDANAAFTLLAPTNSAITALGSDVLNMLIDDPSGKLTKVLEDHVVLGVAFSVEDMVADGEITMLSGRKLPVRVVGDQVLIGGNTPTVITGDLNADNGVMHLIDEVILPSVPPVPPTIASILADDPRFTVLLAALTAVSERGPTNYLDIAADPSASVTVFAPTNTAFASLGAEFDDVLTSPPRLRTLIERHVVVDRRTSSDLLDHRKVETIGGEEVTVRSNNGVVLVNEARVTEADIEAVNGIVHVVDRPIEKAETPDPPPPPPVVENGCWPRVAGALLALLVALLFWLILSGDDPDPDPPPPDTTTSTAIETTTTTTTTLPPLTTDPEPPPTTDPDHGEPPPVSESTLPVEIVHGLTGLVVDIFIVDGPAVDDAEPFTIAGPVHLESGIYGIEIWGDGTEEQLYGGAFQVTDVPLTVAAYFDDNGDIQLAEFADPMHGEPLPAGTALVAVRNLDSDQEALHVEVADLDPATVALLEERQFQIPAAPASVRISGEVKAITPDEGQRVIFTVIDGRVAVQYRAGDADPPSGIPAGDSGLKAAESDPIPFPVLLLMFAGIAAVGGVCGSMVQTKLREARVDA